MFTTFKRRIAKLEDVTKKSQPKSLDHFVGEVQDYIRRTGVSLDDALTKFCQT